MNAIWLSGKRIGDRIFNIFTNFDIDITMENCPAETPQYRKKVGNLLVLIASGDRKSFAESWKQSSVKTKTALSYTLTGIIGFLRRLPDDEEYLYPEPSSGWLDLLRTLQISQSPLFPQSSQRLQTLAANGQLHSEEFPLLENIRETGLLKNMPSEKAAFSLEAMFLPPAQSSARACKHKPTGLYRKGEH
ncbi:hypothetical protein [Candidatus Kuenenia stuttgartiensis]|nr:hypothetical protein [Candidatus Kuenenia stuttgartiensis]